MKATWMAPFVLALAATPALAVDTSSNVQQQQSQTQGNVSPNAINPGQGKQPDGYNDGGENQQHTDDFGPSRTANAEGATDIGDDRDTDTGTNADNADNDTNGDNDTNAVSNNNADSGASAERGSSVDSSASNDTGKETDS
ncbi:hypothetical protein GCM10010082_01800 [Kushneria pakistanensis]|uniref:Dentin sialophosphoprotein n=1 Tax=Kushneria pakistanensis TaxID=1508770 RepID=A0ABQ3F9I6_9GAMM|nr:hypothetical protein [Kushneria pakistanensis]GHC15029.1 hypothetical protein GCM10010082_01800 [Kushneria pakistanensis]